MGGHDVLSLQRIVFPSHRNWEKSRESIADHCESHHSMLVRQKPVDSEYRSIEPVRLDFHHDADLHHLFRGNMEE